MVKISCIVLLLLFLEGADAQPLPDPTRPAKVNTGLTAAGQQNSLQLSAVFISQQSKQAIINNKSVIEGQIIQGFTVFSITPDRVELRGPEGSKILHVYNNNIKKDVNDVF